MLLCLVFILNYSLPYKRTNSNFDCTILMVCLMLCKRSNILIQLYFFLTVEEIRKKKNREAVTWLVLKTRHEQSRMSHQRGSLWVLLVDFLSLSQQLLNVSQHLPLRRRSCLVDHLLGDACQSITSGTTVLMTGEVVFSRGPSYGTEACWRGSLLLIWRTRRNRDAALRHNKMLVTHKTVCFYTENASLFVLTG